MSLISVDRLHKSFMTLCFFFFFKQKTAYELRISDWSSDVCSSDLPAYFGGYINQNFVEIVAALGLDAGHAITLARNSFDASFVSDAQKAGYHALLDSYCQQVGVH